MTVGVDVESVDVSTTGAVGLSEDFFELLIGDDPTAETDDPVPSGERITGEQPVLSDS